MKHKFPRKSETTPWQEWLWNSLRLAPGDQCWEWKFRTDEWGYGVLNVEGIPRKTHRLAWQLLHGSIPFGGVILQTCNNRKCCRPNHLYLATQRKTGVIYKIPWKDRLWKNISKQNGDGCWEWNGAKNINGYGILNIDQVPILTHRLAWKSENGEIENGLHVLHKCNNPPCCRPSHLYLGKDKENARDRVLAGTTTKGEKNPGSKFTEQQILEIRKKGRTIGGTELAKMYGVYPSAISKIINRRNWKHI